MKKRHLLAVILIFVLTLLLSGCGKPETPEEIWTASQKASAGLQCTKMDMTMDMGMTMELPVEGMALSMRMDIRMDGTVITNTDPIASRSDMTMDMKVSAPDLGVNQQNQMEMQSYSVVENGELVSYTETMGTWVRTATGMNPEDVVKYADEILNVANLTFQKDETVTEWEGTPAICLTTTVTGDAVQSVLDITMQGMEESMAEGMEALDFSAMTCPTRIYLDAETYLPLAQEVEIQGMGEVMGTILGEEGLDMDVDTCTAVVRYRSFDSQEPIVLPQEAKENAVDA